VQSELLYASANNVARSEQIKVPVDLLKFEELDTMTNLGLLFSSQTSIIPILCPYSNRETMRVLALSRDAGPCRSPLLFQRLKCWQASALAFTSILTRCQELFIYPLKFHISLALAG
jgi:hypothetical protein